MKARLISLKFQFSKLTFKFGLQHFLGFMHHFFRYHQFIPFLKFYLSTFLMIATKKIIFSIINIKFQKKVNFPFSISSLAVLHSPFSILHS